MHSRLLHSQLWVAAPKLEKKYSALSMMGAQLRTPLNPLNTIVL